MRRVYANGLSNEKWLLLRRLMGSRGLCFEGWKTADESEFSMHG